MGGGHLIEKTACTTTGATPSRSASARTTGCGPTWWPTTPSESPSPTARRTTPATRGLGHGIQVNAEATDSRLVKNYVTRNGIDGIHVESVTTTITKNDARQNTDLGINAPGAIDGGHNKAKGNGNPLQCVGVVCS